MVFVGSASGIDVGRVAWYQDAKPTEDTTMIIIKLHGFNETEAYAAEDQLDALLAQENFGILVDIEFIRSSVKSAKGKIRPYVEIARSHDKFRWDNDLIRLLKKVPMFTAESLVEIRAQLTTIDDSLAI